MSKQNKAEEPKQDKVMTKYDRKMQARKLKEEKDKKSEWIAKTAGIIIAVAIAAAVIISVGLGIYNRQKALSGTYVKIGNHEVTGVEYDFYYHTMVANYLNMYSSFLPYMGLDTTQDFAAQQYDENTTWKDYFDEMTAAQLVETKALVDDASAQGFAYETADEDYQNFTDGFKTAAETAEVSVADYYKTSFGTYATQSRLKPFIQDTLLASAYYNHLIEENKPSDEEITAYYEENKNNYDNVDYRLFTFDAEVEEEADDEEKEAAVTAAEEKANTMMEERLAGEEFQALCDKYEVTTEEETADAEDKDAAEDESTEKNLIQGASYSSISTQYSEWLYEEARTAGDITVIRDDDNSKCYVVEFVQRTFNENTNDSISNTLATQAVEEYKETLTVNYEVLDVAGELRYLTIPEEEEESLAEEETPSEGNTEETEE